MSTLTSLAMIKRCSGGSTEGGCDLDAYTGMEYTGLLKEKFEDTHFACGDLLSRRLSCLHCMAQEDWAHIL